MEYLTRSGENATVSVIIVCEASEFYHKYCLYQDKFRLKIGQQAHILSFKASFTLSDCEGDGGKNGTVNFYIRARSHIAKAKSRFYGFIVFIIYCSAVFEISFETSQSESHSDSQTMIFSY